MKWTRIAPVIAASFQLATTGPVAAADWKDMAYSPVANPIFFESPFIASEVRPIFIQQSLAKTFNIGGANAPVGGDVRVYAAELRWAVNDRLAVIASKDGFVDFRPQSTLTPHTGWADISLGLKYALVDKPEDQFILTPGFEADLPTGNKSVFQGSGKGGWDLFVASAKGWGGFRLIGNIGLRVPNDSDLENLLAHYSLQADYYVHRYFIPMVSLNAMTTLTKAQGLPLNFEGFDLINFGSSNGGGRTQAVLGGGFRSRLHDRADFGFAYEKSITTPRGVFDDRITVDLIIRF